MIIVVIITAISFLLEAIFSNFISINTYFFAPLFTLISLLIIYPYFYNSDKKYLLIVFVIGLIYDITYTNTLMFHAVIFLVIGLIIIKLNIIISNNTLNIAFMSFIIIIIYRIISYILYLIIGYGNFTLMIFLYSIASSLILNMIYGSLLYIISDYVARKKHIKKID